MSDTNTYIVTGRLTKDPRVVELPSGTKLVEGSLATNRVYGRGDDRKEETSFIDFKVFGDRGNYLADKGKKGVKILVEGRIVQERWEDSDSGKQVSKLVVVADDYKLLSSGPSSEQTASGSKSQKSTSAGGKQNTRKKDDNIPF